MSGNKKSQAGFTLVEIIVVLGIFSVLVVVILNVFILALRSQRQAAFRQQTLSNLRYIVETIAKQVRTSEIDYSYPYDKDGDNGIVGAESELYLKDSDGNSSAYYLKNGELYLTSNGQDSPLTNINDIKIVTLSFFIAPSTNPFTEERCNAAVTPNGCQPTISCTVDDSSNVTFKTGFCLCTQNQDCATNNCDTTDRVCLPPDVQPRVTLVLGFESAQLRPEDIKRIYLQTTATSRIYKR
ncbi:MAG: type II secretion system protein [Patescibacteria group bacterium]|nr:type II secretion system protein [Patescibacteria group bacterium]